MKFCTYPDGIAVIDCAEYHCGDIKRIFDKRKQIFIKFYVSVP